MQTSVRELFTSVHGILFGGFFLMAFFAVVVEMVRSSQEVNAATYTPRGCRVQSWFLAVMALLGWLAVLTGTYVVYPWYRAAPPAGLKALSAYPRSLLLSQPATAPLHSLGMEWKEHVGWFAPVLATMVAVVWMRQRHVLRENAALRRAVMTFAWVGILATGVAGLTGALLDKAAPVTGGSVVMIGGAH